MACWNFIPWKLFELRFVCMCRCGVVNLECVSCILVNFARIPAHSSGGEFVPAFASSILTLLVSRAVKPRSHTLPLCSAGFGHVFRSSLGGAELQCNSVKSWMSRALFSNGWCAVFPGALFQVNPSADSEACQCFSLD